MYEYSEEMSTFGHFMSLINANKILGSPDITVPLIFDHWSFIFIIYSCSDQPEQIYLITINSYT